MDAIQVTPKVKTVHAKPKVKPLPIKPKVKPAQASSYAKPDQATSKSTSVQAKTWDLKETEKEAATESFDQGEKVLDGPDERVLVNPNDLTPGGKYRCKSFPFQLSYTDQIQLLSSCRFDTKDSSRMISAGVWARDGLSDRTCS